ncbi:helix-turn-helix domain-containing protein [Nonomuraea fuscirosea]|uniref:helix-turn-helix transcriptional regulator n=1 Tax=Nonomuraea fuscirosea TaxID=1291556 RepID=UPI002DDAD971|nr:helix-turn-helix transcriptional regulator [Nonomuraea fuscirosea]WSA57884.1 helix-turn-helix domain-containing protein [Nonomuraea fuscirosea]
MPTAHGGIGRRIAYHRSVARLTQQQLADAATIHVGTLRKIERGARGAGDGIVEAIAAALDIDPSMLLADREHASSRVRAALPGLSAAIAAYDLPDDGPVRPMPELRQAVAQATTWRLGSQYVRIAGHVPALLSELFRALHATPATDPDVARLVASALRSADSVAFKFGAHDLSARLIELMRWACTAADDPILDSAVAYTRTETFFAAHAYGRGLRALEIAIDAATPPDAVPAIAARGALHMRAAVIAGRDGDVDAADMHLAEARRLGDQVPEAVYVGTAFGPHSVRIHEVSVAVSLGSEHVHRALEVAREWAPPPELPAERRSGFYIELARAQLWSGLPDDAFESLKVARKIAPQHTRDHRWVREDAGTLRRLKRADAESLTSFAEWCHAT